LTQLVALTYYPFVNTLGRFVGYRITEKALGNIAQIVNVIPPEAPSYLSFNPPRSTQSFNYSDMRWTYVYTNRLYSKTEFNFYSEDSTSPNNLHKDRFEIAGKWILVNESAVCKVLRN
jgi:hypothetical protein